MKRLTVCCFLVWSIAYQVDADTNGKVNVFGVDRNFVYAVSTYPAPPTGRPLVIFLHGNGGNMGLSPAWKQAVLNDANGAVLLSAQGRNNTAAAIAGDDSAWRFRMDEQFTPYDDVDFISQIIIGAPTLLGTPISWDQVYVVGESRGAMFAYFLLATPRVGQEIRAIVPISGSFYCEGAAVAPGVPGTEAQPGSDDMCGYVNPFGFWGPRPQLFAPKAWLPNVPHILDIHGQLPPNGSEGWDTSPPALNTDGGATNWAGWGDAAGCYTVQVSSQTEQTLAQPIGGKMVKTYAYSQAAGNLATRCANLDLTFYIAQGGGHVPGGFERAAWCFLSTVGGTPSASACDGTPPVDNSIVRYFGFIPNAIRDSSSTNPEFYIVTDGTPSLVQLRLANGESLNLASGPGNRWSITLTNAQVLYGYTATDYNHNWVGFLDVWVSGVNQGPYNIFMNVLDQFVPQVTPVSVGAQAQKTAHLVNLRLPGLAPATMDNAYVTKNFYQDFGDDYDFINIIYTPEHAKNRYFQTTRNDVSGLGLPIYDYDADYGVPPTHRLKGIIFYPIWYYFDLGEGAFIHELGHSWINFLTVPKLQGVTPHWPLSSLASGMMGWQCFDCGYPQGLEFPYTLVPDGEGNYTCVYSGVRPTAYNDMELYLMGFLPSSEVGSYIVFSNQNQTCPGILNGPVQTVTVQDVINQHGARSPSWLMAQKKFRVATIVVSQSFLNHDEMSFLDYFAARGGMMVPLPYTSGFSSGVTLPFYLATGRRGCMVTTIDHDGGCYEVYLPLILR